MRLKLDRLDTIETIEFTLQRGSEVLKHNNLRILNGKLVPVSLSDEDARCLLSSKSPLSKTTSASRFSTTQPIDL